ncbi:MAG: TetR/AcrR family transcriptional regulator [Mycobacterium sp.]
MPTGKHQVAPVRRTQSERRAETRRRVLDAATALVAQHGSRAVSLADVGNAAGYSRGIVNHHFGSKARLLEALIEHTQNFDVPTDAPNGLGRLTAIIETYLGTVRQRSPSSEAFLKLWTESAGAEPSLQAMFVERDAWFRRLLVEHVRDGIADGSIRDDVDPASTALMIVGTLRGTAMLLMSTARDVPAAALSLDVGDVITRGLSTRARAEQGESGDG